MSVGLSFPNVAPLLGSVLAKQITVKPSSASVLPPNATAVVALYVDDQGSPVCFCAADLSLAANAGAALALYPAQAATDCIRTAKLDSELLENFREVLNICARLFDSALGQHVSLRSVYLGLKQMPPNEMALFTSVSPNFKSSFEVSIAGYGGGRLSLLVAAK